MADNGLVLVFVFGLVVIGLILGVGLLVRPAGVPPRIDVADEVRTQKVSIGSVYERRL